jgi:hypothetical protein
MKARLVNYQLKILLNLLKRKENHNETFKRI